MTDRFSIGYSNQTETQVLCSNQRWTLTTGRDTDRLHYGTQTTDQDKKIKSPRFAFLKIFASAHLAHLQCRTSPPIAQALQKSQILPALKESGHHKK